MTDALPHSDSSRENIGCYGCDPDGLHKRMVYPIIDSGHLARSFGLAFEHARNTGAEVELTVGRVHRAADFAAQLLVYSGRHPSDRDGFLAHAMRASPHEFEPCIEIRHGYVSFKDEVMHVRLATGEPVHVGVAGSPYGPFADGDWLWVADDTPSNEQRPEFSKQENPDIMFHTDRGTGMWVLEGIMSSDAFAGRNCSFQFVGVPAQMSLNPSEIYYIGPHPDGERPFVLNQRQKDLIVGGLASKRLLATVRKEAYRLSLFNEGLTDDPASFVTSTAKAYGVWYPQKLIISDYVMGGSYCVEFGDNIPVKSASAASAPSEADDLVASA